jgi:hypothetical protein
MLMGLGDPGVWQDIEHSGILTSTLLPFSQVFFMAPEQQFGAFSIADPIAECAWALAIS